MKTQQAITGGIIVVLGLILTFIAIVKFIFTLIYGLPLIIIGIVILLNNKEDVVEKIKKSRKK